MLLPWQDLFFWFFPASAQQVSQQTSPQVAAQSRNGSSQTAEQTESSDSAKQVLALEEQMEALQRSNSAKRTALWADDLVYIGNDSRVHDKLSLARAVSAGEVKIESLDVSDRKIRVYGDLAIVTATEKRKASFHGKEPQDQTLQYTRVWARRSGA